ncbi:MAG: cell division protein FtsQ/DivIB [Lawsonibacter sp.]
MAPVRNNRRRRRGRGRFGPLFKLLCALAVVVALTMGATVFFQVETVVVSGNSRYTQEEVVQATGIQTGDNLFRMNKYQVARQVRQTLPYVGEVMIRRSLPSTILITVSEWDSVARVEVPQSTGALSAGDSSAAASSESDSAEGDGTGKEAEVAQEAWLISVGGKLLEPAPADSTVLSVTGITPLMPKAGTMLTLPQEEQGKLNALLALLDNLNKLDMLGQVSSIQFGSTQVSMRYLDRFDVKILLNADFNYKLRALAAAVEETEKKLGDETTGTFDLTREDFTVVYSPE